MKREASPQEDVPISDVSSLPEEETTEVSQNLVRPKLKGSYRAAPLNRMVGLERDIFLKLDDRRAIKTAEDFYDEAAEGYDEPPSLENSVEKTPEQKEVCEAVFALLPGFFQKYGLEEPVELKPERATIYDLSQVPQHLWPEADQRGFVAHYSPKIKTYAFSQLI